MSTRQQPPPGWHRGRGTTRGGTTPLYPPGPARGQFARERLPAPAEYYQAQGLRLRGSGAWRSAICPFHADTQPSLRINVEHGCYRCMACGARGGDVLAFHQQRTGLSFSAAARELGAWVEARR